MRYVIAVAAVLVLSLVAVGAQSPAPAQAQQRNLEVAPDDSGDALETPWIVLRRRGNGKIGMSWNNVAGATQYRLVVECTSAGCTDPSDDFTRTRGTHSYVFLTRPLDQTYRVKIRAEQSEPGAPSAWSAWVNEAPLPVLAVMDAPTVQAQPNGDLVVNWPKLSGATRYLVQINCASASCSHTLSEKVGDISSYTFLARRMHSGKDYRARIVPGDAHGARENWSPWSASVTLTIPASAVTEIPTFTVMRRGNGKLGVNWAPIAGSTAFDIHRECTTPGCTEVRQSRVRYRATYGFVRTTPNKEFRVKMRVVKGSQVGPWSDWVNETPLPALAVMDAPTVQAQANGDLLVNWPKLSGATRYLVQIDCISASCSHTLNGVAGDDSSFTFLARRMHSGKDYRARIVPADSHGAREDWSDWSASATLNSGGS